VSHPVDAAIGGLVAVWHDEGDLEYDVDGVLTKLRVTDNPLLEEGFDERRLLLVGTSAQYLPGGAQASSSFDLAGERVQVDIVCELTVWSGDTDAPAERAAAFEVLDTLAALLARRRDLFGSVDWARITRATYEPGQTEQGAAASVEFTVRVDASREHPQ